MLLNLMVVMTVAGLWHGAGWPFALWGLIHGLYLCTSRFIPTPKLRALLPVPARLRAGTYDALSTLVFFHLTVFAWIPFRAPDLTTTFQVMRSALRFDDWASWSGQITVLVGILALFGLHILERILMEHAPTQSRAWQVVPRAAQAFAILSVILLLVITSGNESNDFIYFRF